MTPISHQAAQDVENYRESWGVSLWPYFVGPAALVLILAIIALVIL